MSLTKSVPWTSNADILGILSFVRWDSTVVAYAFPTRAGDYAGYASGEETATFSALTATQQAAAERTLGAYAAVSNLTFVRSDAAKAQLLFGNSGLPKTAWAYYPSEGPRGGDVWFGTTDPAFLEPTVGSYGWAGFLHEVGHALGLDHGHEGAYVLPSNHDSMEWSVMTYRSTIGGSTDHATNAPDSYAQSLMRIDIAAIQYLYGANYATQSGDTVYSFDPSSGTFSIDGVSQGPLAGQRVFRTIWDGGGIDTYDFHAFNTGMAIDLRPGEGSILDRALLAKLDGSGTLASANVYNAFLYGNDTRSLIENATGGDGSDTIVGNEAANWLRGNGGDDDLTGGAGDDTIDGGAGTNSVHYGFDRSYYRISLVADMTVSIAGVGGAATEGVDTVSNVNWFWFQSVRVSFADLTKPGTWTGTVGNDSHAGTDAGETLSGLGGRDTLVGGAGADLIYGGDDNDQVLGGGGADTILGGDGDDDLYGGAGDDSIDGGRGLDSVRYVTGWTNISFDVDSYTGLVTVVDRSVGSTLETDKFANVEQFAFGPFGSWFDYKFIAVRVGTQSAERFELSFYDTIIATLGGDDTIVAFSPNGTVDGGAGRDRLEAVSTADSMIVDLAAGTALRRAYGFTDSMTVKNVEDVAGLGLSDTLLGDGGGNLLSGLAGNDSLGGRDGADTLLGGDGADTLDGGDGDDSLSGGEGDDRLVASAGKDTVDGGGGLDTVVFDKAYGAYDWRLSTTATVEGFISITDRATSGITTIQHVEWLQFTDRTVGLYLGNGSAESVVGSAGADLLYGAPGADTLDGAGGDDSVIGGADGDSLSGGAGDDMLRGNTGNDTLDGGEGEDSANYAAASSAVTVDLAAGTANGGAGDDLLRNIEDVFGSTFDDSIAGDDGENWLAGDEGNDTLDGRGGLDWADLSNGIAGVVASLADGTASGGSGNDVLRNIEALRGSRFDDRLAGDTGNNSLRGDGGNDTLDGGAGSDWVFYHRATGAVSVDLGVGRASGADGDDVLVSIENARGSAFADTITGSGGANSMRGMGGDDVLDGGAGFDWADYRQAGNGVAVSLATGAASALDGTVGTDGRDRLLNIEGVRGSMFADRLTGDTGDNALRGLKGADTLDGGAGSDTADYSQDEAYGGTAGVLVNLGNVDLPAGPLPFGIPGTLPVTLRAHTARDGFGDTDTLVAIETVRGTGFGDGIVGSQGDNSLAGGGGNDTIGSGGGRDTIDAGDGDDVVVVGLSGETVDGGTGDDVVYFNDGQGLLRFADVRRTLTIDADGTLRSSGLGGSATVLRNVERFGFQDGTISLDEMKALLANRAPTDLSVAGTSVAENSPAGTLVGQASAKDVDAGDTLTYRLLGADRRPYDGPFRIEAATGRITVAPGASLDYELARSYRVTVTATDTAGHVVETSVTIAIIDVKGVISGQTQATGTGENDLLTGTAAADTLQGEGGNDSLAGLSGNDSLDGGAGSDTLDGAQGADTMAGGDGNDTYVVDNAGDMIVERAGEGTDTVRSTLALTTLADNVENGVYAGKGAATLAGNGLANALTGGAGNDSLDGGDGNDRLDGGLGADTMAGGVGADTFVIDNRGDVILDAAANDLVVLKVIGYAGDTGAARLSYALTGGASADSLSGGLFGDTLDGGKGADTLAGAAGNDTYVVDDAGDVILEEADGGTDTVRTSLASFALADTLENLVLLSAAGATGIGNGARNAISGGAGADIIEGRDGNDTLSGGAGRDSLLGGEGNDSLDGGTGADTLTGGAGNDTLAVDDIADVVLGAEAGDVVVLRTAGFDLATLGAAEIRYALTGMAGGQSLAGGDFADTLDGGLDVDTMAGGLGNDTYLVDNARDLAVEEDGGGTDTVRTSLSAYALGAFIENLVLQNASGALALGNDLANVILGTGGADSLGGLDGNDTLSGGAGADELFGGTGRDVLQGGLGDDDLEGDDGNDTLDGGLGADTLDGGDGADRLTGGGGADLFVLRALTGTDVITDFAVGVDRIVLDSIMAANGSHLDFLGSKLASGTAGVAYSATSGLLSLDWTADGKADMQVQMGRNLAVSRSDFLF